MDIFTKIKQIFYSGNEAFPGLNEPINEIAFLIDEGYLAITPIHISTKNEYLDFISNQSGNKEKKYDASGGGITHVALKVLSGKYLETEKGLEVQYEQSFCGYYPDVITQDKSIIVECGLTQNPDKILAYFQQGHIKEFIQVPYPTEESNSVLGYSFIPQNNLREFLIFLQENKNSQIKNILKNRKRENS